MNEPNPHSPIQRWHLEKQGGPEYLKKPKSKGRLIFLAVTGMLAVAGVIGGMLSWLAPVPRPTLVALWVNDYQHPSIPAPMQAQHDQQAMVDSGLFADVLQPNAGTQRHALVGELNALRERGASESVVVYLSAMASRDKNGQVAVFAGNSDPSVPNTPLPLATVLQCLAECPAQHKLLVLDIMRPDADARRGTLVDDVGSLVEQELKSVEDPGRLVLCACSPGQVSLASEAARRSIFSLYIDEALRGWADGCGPTGSADGRVTVTELAAYVQARVDRWAQRNRNLRQTPILYGDTAADFTLAAVDLNDSPTHVSPPAAVTYPDWLKAAWLRQDQELAEGRWRWTPRNFARQAAWLLKVEADWRAGLDPSYIQQNHLVKVQQLRDQAVKTRALPLPEPQSLALALAFGEKDDKEVVKSLQEFLAKLQPMKGGDPRRPKLVDEYSEKFAKVRPLSRAMAVVQQAERENEPTRARLELFGGLLQPELDSRPRYVETLLVQRLAEMAGQRETKTWPVELVRKLLQTAAHGEVVTTLYEVNAWNAPLLAEADQLRHDGEVMFWARGFGSPADADQLLSKAEAKYALAGQRADIVIKARQTLDGALFLLPAFEPYLEHAPESVTAWLGAVRTSRELDSLLNGPAETGTDGLRKIDGLQDVADLLQDQLTALRQPFAAEKIAALVQRGKQPKADPAVVDEIHALLRTPLLKSADRELLWQVGYDLERRMHQQTLRTDQDDDERRIALEPLEPANAQQAMQRENDKAHRRATTSIALLELAGLPSEQIQPLRELVLHASKKRFDSETLGLVSDALMLAWSKQLPSLLHTDTSLEALDRLSRLLPPLETVAAVDDLTMSLPVQMRLREAKAQWTRLGEHYRYLSRDYRGAGLDWSPQSSGELFYGQAALAYLPQPAGQNALSLSSVKELPRLSVNRTRADCPIQLEWSTTQLSKDAVDVRVQSPNAAWLTVEPSKTELRGVAMDPAFPLSLTASLVLDIRLAVGNDQVRGAPPKGFLVAGELDGRRYHFKVPVSIQTAPDQPQLFLSTSKQNPGATLSEIRLRPGKVRQPIYFYARNPGDTARKVTIEITAGETPIKGGAMTVVLPPNSTQRLNLGDPAALPAVGLAPFQGPLQWRVTDPDAKNEVLDEQSIPVIVATPRDYVRVTNIQFTPTNPDSGKNRLAVTAQVYAPPGGPEIPVELVLPPSRIPGFISAVIGTFRGELAADGNKDGSTVELLAEKILFQEGEEEEGVVYVNVDGYDRAFIFRTVFARTGAPTTPRADLRPTVRVRANRFVRPDLKFVLPLEVDSPPEGCTLEVTVGQFIGGEFKTTAPARKFPTAKRTQVGFSPNSPDGGMLFEGDLQDWVMPLDTTRLLGQHEVLARLVDRNGKEIAKTMHTLIVDDSIPEGVHFINLPKAVKRGSRITLDAAANPGGSDITDVQFFMGKPADGKVPANTPTYKGTLIDKTTSRWQAELQLPEDKKGPTDVSVLFTNQIGLSSLATTSLELTDTDPATTGPGRIKGKVVLGELAQPGLEVSLKDEKGAEKAKAKTKSDGTFVFEQVPPGRYSVYCRKNEVQRHGTANAVVQPNSTVEVTVSLTLRVTKK